MVSKYEFKNRCLFGKFINNFTANKNKTRSGILKVDKNDLQSKSTFTTSKTNTREFCKEAASFA